ncbi:YihY/virulence factor BrkB family protein [Roseomonas sp. NAR14]|uniref:YihY/virulence factor BrkB family protein n=1 Tax=Roseomonas acroporae TaxID=2937791 RepID=A0A9X1Y605_9PROT|nr:YihY/virulence factor BrkB family protein [Roseomonas acroporae]MCK8784599.1 YihY/virulence factor BrkB family protein [Roseomonas acroporae]
MLGNAWRLLKQTVVGFIEDEALSRGAAIAYYVVTSLAPVLIIVIAIAGLAFGEAAATGAIVHQLSGLMGEQSAELLQNLIRSASDRNSGIAASLVGVVILVVTASGVFGEMQASLNVIWRASPKGDTVARLLRARAVSLGLVAALGFLLLVSLVISAALTALGNYMSVYLPETALLLRLANMVVSFVLITMLIAAIYKVLPDCDLEWRDVGIGAVVTTLLFVFGKYLIGLYLGSSTVASSYGAAGALVIILIWIYYSAQIFLLGAEFTRAYAGLRAARGERCELPAKAPLSSEPALARLQRRADRLGLPPSAAREAKRRRESTGDPAL